MARPQTIDRDTLLDAAEAVVLSEGAARLTIEAVAKTAGVSKGGVLYHYRTKDTLIAAMLKRYFDRCEALASTLSLDYENHPNALTLGHIEATRRETTATNTKAAGLMAALVQSGSYIESIRTFYRRRLEEINLTTDEGQRARLALIAVEGAVLLSGFGFMEISDRAWNAVFDQAHKLAAEV